jgi:hypothetical protein
LAEAQPGEPTSPNRGLSLSALADYPRWVTWRNEPRAGQPTKVPYSPGTDRKAKADDPGTWATRRKAEAAIPRLVNGTGGGIGLELGDLGDGLALGGIDLDTCRSADGAIEPWALEVVQRLNSYTEISPSGTGAKIFFTYAAGELASLRAAMGKLPDEGSGRKWARGKGRHVPSIELYLGGRFFAVTEQQLPAAPIELRPVSMEVLLWLIREAGPAFASADKAAAPKPGADGSRSAIAFRKGAALRRAGRTFEEMCADLRSGPQTAEWCREKGDANGGRELRRIWDKAALPLWLNGCQRNSRGQLLSNLANALVALRKAPELLDLFRYDDMLRLPLLAKPLDGYCSTFTQRPVCDEDVTGVQEWLQLAGLTSISTPPAWAGAGAGGGRTEALGGA